MRERKFEKYLIKSPKQMIMVIAVFTLMIFVGGTTYAFFNYTRTGSANTVSVGRISFVSSQSSGSDNKITLSNVFPIATSAVSTDTNNVGTLEIAVTGDTDYSGGIEYLVSSTNTNITTSTGKLVPLSLQVSVNGLGTSSNNYFTARESTTSNIYKKLVGDTLVGDQMLLVGFITPNNPTGTIAGVNGTITIKAYFDESKILVSDTYDGTESDNMGTPNSLAQGKTVLTTAEWNNLSSSGISFQIKVEANEGIWVNGSLEEIMRSESLGVDTTQGVDFSKTSDQDNTKGVYLRNGTQNDAYPIVYYRGAVENNNVLFNNKCWKAVRTTDTGGVKLIYNGESRAIYNEQFADPNTYATEHDRDIFTFDSTDGTWNYEVNDGQDHEISFKVPAGDNYEMIISGTTGSTCGLSFTVYRDGTSVNGGGGGGGSAINFTYSYGTLTSSNVLKVSTTGASSTSSSCSVNLKINMQQGTTKLLKNDYSMLVEKDTGELVCDNTGVDTHINISGTNKFAFSGNNLNKSPAYVGYMWGTVYEYKNGSKNGTYWSDVDYSGGRYTLKTGGTTNSSLDSTHHYICEDSTNCIKVRYYYMGTFNYYIELENGDTIEKALEKMQANTTSSNAKTKIDTWYESNMNTVTNKLEDTIWCNDRSVGKYNGWSKTGSWNTSVNNQYSLLFGSYERSNYASNDSTVKNQPNLSCVNKNDAFTVSNGKGNQKLQYPVALLTEDEMVLAGGLAGSQSTFYLNNGSTEYWSLSPNQFFYSSAEGFVIRNGSIDLGYGSGVGVAYGLRPAISLKPGMPVVSGDGTVTSPYIIE